MSRKALRLLLAAGLLGILAGCGRDSTPPATPHAAATSSDTSSVPENASAPAPVTPVAVNDTGDVSAQLGQLTEAVRKYSFEHRRLARSLDEVVAAGYVRSLPAAPAGKKFSIESKSVQVVLVNK